MPTPQELISDRDIEEGKKSLEKQIINPFTRKGAFEAGLFCICSQATPWETASNFIYGLRRKSFPDEKDAMQRYAALDIMTDVKLVNEVAEDVGWRFAYGNRFEEYINYFGKERYEDPDWHERIRDADSSYRAKIVKDVKWIGGKTLSFWHICLGGKKLLALDVWIMKKLRELGVDIEDKYTIPQSREPQDQKVRVTPSKKIYLAFEDAAKEIFSSDKRFLLPDGSVDLAMVDGVLWWMGANRADPNQLELGLEKGTLKDFPYSKIIDDRDREKNEEKVDNSDVPF